MVLFMAVVPLTAAGAGTAFAAKGGADRPFASSGAATVTVDLSQGIDVGIAGTVNATHMGRSTWNAEVTGINLGATAVDVEYTSTWIAANGDTLTAEGSGSIDLIAMGFTATETITGGTGRFSGASGSLALSGAAGAIDDSNPGLISIGLSVSSTGSISY